MANGGSRGARFARFAVVRGGLRVAAVAMLAGAGLAATGAQAQDLRAVSIGTFERPVYVTTAPGKNRLLFVVEQAGQIKVLFDDVPETRPFLDIRDMVFGPPDTDAHNEQGLLSMAFAPNYRRTGRFYVAFTNGKGDLEVAEFRRSAKNARRADPSTYRRLLTVRHRDAGNHNGGQLQFGRDGYLYISTGDGGGGGDPWDAARDLDNLLGKLLRIDPRPSEVRPYRIPRSNPFRKRAGRNELYAYGLRNPWRFSFDKKRVVIADVGQNIQEEINLLATKNAAGANFGWPQYEGNLVFDNARPGADPATFPNHVYNHDNGECSVTGGYVVRDPDLPALAGRYLYADFCVGEIRTFRANRKAADDQSTGLTLPFLTSFGMGHKGKLYAMQFNGEISRLDPVPADPDN